MKHRSLNSNLRTLDPESSAGMVPAKKHSFKGFKPSAKANGKENFAYEDGVINPV